MPKNRWLIAIGALLAQLAGCPSYDVLVVRYAAREMNCPESQTRIVERSGPGRWRLLVCGETRSYAGYNGEFSDVTNGASYSESSAGPHCTTGCRCGRSCIPCSHRCYH